MPAAAYPRLSHRAAQSMVRCQVVKKPSCGAIRGSQWAQGAYVLRHSPGFFTDLCLVLGSLATFH
jgi:hypothetical protein